MNETHDGDSAFPTVARDGNWQPHHDGMTLLDYFAAHAMAAIVGQSLKHFDTPEKVAIIAENAYIIAEAMLDEREVK